MVEKGVERSKSKKLLSRCSSFMSSKEHKQRAATIAQSTSSSAVASRRRRSLMTVCRSKTTYCAPTRHPPAPPLRKSNSGASGEGGGLEDIFWNLGLGLQQVCCVFFGIVVFRCLHFVSVLFPAVQKPYAPLPSTLATQSLLHGTPNYEMGFWIFLVLMRGLLMLSTTFWSVLFTLRSIFFVKISCSLGVNYSLIVICQCE